MFTDTIITLTTTVHTDGEHTWLSFVATDGSINISMLDPTTAFKLLGDALRAVQHTPQAVSITAIDEALVAEGAAPLEAEQTPPPDGSDPTIPE